MKKSHSKKKAKSKKKSKKRRHLSLLPYNDRWLGFAWIIPALLIVIALGVLVRPGVHHPLALTSAKLIDLFQKAPAEPMGERVAFWGENLMKDPALLSALGSGPDVLDSAPLFTKFFDCTTYVETVGALAKSHTGEDLADQLISIRYKDGKTTYENRNHFPEADWIPNNEASGVIRDITVQIARQSGFVASFANKDIDKVAWFKSQKEANRVVATNDNNQTTTVRLAYIPIEKMDDAIGNIPQGAIINVVHENKERYPVLIGHQGFLIWKNGVAYFRHASRNRQIKEVPFTSYIQQARGMAWKAVGFNINTFEG